ERALPRFPSRPPPWARRPPGPSKTARSGRCRATRPRNGRACAKRARPSSTSRNQPPDCSADPARSWTATAHANRGRPPEGRAAGKPEEAAVVARRFATRDQVALAIGSVSSPASLAAAQVFREEELPQIVVSGTAQRITTQGNEWVFRSAVPDRKLVGDMVDF